MKHTERGIIVTAVAAVAIIAILAGWYFWGPIWPPSTYSGSWYTKSGFAALGITPTGGGGDVNASWTTGNPPPWKSTDDAGNTTYGNNPYDLLPTSGPVMNVTTN